MKKSDDLMYKKLLEFWENMEDQERGTNPYIDYWLDYLTAYSNDLADIEEHSND